MIRVNFSLGEITQLQADALIVPIHSSGTWANEANRAIYQSAGDFYHYRLDKALKAVDTTDGDVFAIKGGNVYHQGGFRDVAFVIDDFRLSLDQIVRSALLYAGRYYRYNHVSMPVMRSMEEVESIESGLIEIARVMRQGIEGFAVDNTDLDLSVTVVTADKQIYELLQSAFGLTLSTG